MNRRTLPLLAAIATTVTILTTGCGDLETMGNPYNHTDEEIAAAAALLPTLPTLEDTEKQITDAVMQIADAATAIAPELQWEWRRKRTQFSCGGAFGKTDGLQIDLQNYVSPTPIPDAAWPRILQAARDIAAPLGITQLNVHVDEPGDHDVVLTSDDGNRITFGTNVAAVISATTGCRLPAHRTDPTP
ncbi:putative LppA-like lipoprotein [Rhodococcus sp. OK519]|uniref:LppA family lipoprotein n=1 Tax=Rhodococcus sp. OK519 TaxID=2135729 RepID=UPI000D355AB5|nr:putative LppA-like lipoprotein [Rhodococcus sp. OK519]